MVKAAASVRAPAELKDEVPVLPNQVVPKCVKLVEVAPTENICSAVQVFEAESDAPLP